MMKLTKGSLVAMFLAWLPVAEALAAEIKQPASQAGPGFRSAQLVLPASGRTGFTPLPASLTGILLSNVLSAQRSITNQIYHIGSGVAAGDVDGDGWCDLYFGRIEGGNVLYRNLGNWRFQDVTAAAGVACLDLNTTGVVFADIDGDGDLDLLVNAIGRGTSCFLNDGTGHFKNATANSPFERTSGSTSFALADIDGDGDLDLYVANYRNNSLGDEPDTRFKLKTVNDKLVITSVNGKSVAEPELVARFSVDAIAGILEHGQPDVLYRNDGHGKFTPVPWGNGTFLDEDGKAATAPYDWGLSVMFRDLNGDGAPDIYVCNDLHSPDRIWINSGQGRFRAIPRLALRHTSRYSMGVDVADINRDGFDDLVVLDMLSRRHQARHVQLGLPIPMELVIGQSDKRPQYMRNTLFLNRGDGTYAEIAQAAGVQASEWSWTPIFLDVDLDGFEDLLISNGHVRDAQNLDVAERISAIKAGQKLSRLEKLKLEQLFPRLETPNCAFRNLGDLRFEEVGAAWGFNLPGISQGMALADLDNDGDLDVAVNNFDSAATIYRNDSVAARVAVRLKGQGGNTHGIGAKIKVTGGPVTQTQEMICGGRYLSSDDAIRTFAAGHATNRLDIEVQWRSGKRSVVTNVMANHLYLVEESAAENRKPVTGAQDTGARAHFEDVSDRLGHTHHEAPFDDYERQPLLPWRLSQLGPAVAWGDVNGDGHDDLVIGSGRGGTLGVLLSNGRGGFNRVTAPACSAPAADDQTGIVCWSAAAGASTLLVGQAHYEVGTAVTNEVACYEVWAGGIETPGGWAAGTASPGPLAAADLDGDGDVDVFVGGRVLPGRYPQAASSRVYRNVGGQFELDLANTKRLAQVGLVSGAVWSDLDGDGWPDLVLACEYGPLKVFRNHQGALVAWNPPVTSPHAPPSALQQLTGWWNGVTTGDLDGDGRMDIIASNLGRNTKYQEYLKDEIRLLYGDIDGNGTVDLIEAGFDRELQKIVPLRDRKVASAALPFLNERFTTYAAYASASVEEIYGERLKLTQQLRVRTLDTMLLLNRGDHLEARTLPLEAQLTPAFAVSVADFDGDGDEDLFLSQNFFAVDLETERHDAGRGLLLRGDGQGGLHAVPGQDSGILVYGEQRGSAVSDYDGDGRADLVVTQNGAATKLYRNVGAKPGLRVRLRGQVGNVTGIGATIRLKFGERLGPARELHAGSGYWSQDSAVAVLGTPAMPTQVWVRWPGGRTIEAAVPPGAIEVEVGFGGQVKLLK